MRFFSESDISSFDVILRKLAAVVTREEGAEAAGVTVGVHLDEEGSKSWEGRASLASSGRAVLVWCL